MRTVLLFMLEVRPLSLTIWLLVYSSSRAIYRPFSLFAQHLFRDGTTKW